MIYLLLVSFLWAPSFGLIRTFLKGVDPSFVSFVRLLLSLLVFLPFLRLRGVRPAAAAQLAVIGAVQYGAMYLTYIHAFRYIQAYQVAIFTIFTPLYVAAINDLLERKFHPMFLAAAALAVAGTAVVSYAKVGLSDLSAGFALLQASNLCFAFGQVAYRRVMARCPGVRDADVFAVLYAGAVLATLGPLAVRAPHLRLALSGQQWAVLAYLGTVASAAGFFLWNVGARRTNAGTLAAFNNLKVPLAVAASLLVFGEAASLPRLLAGGAVICIALSLNARRAPA